MRHFHKCFVIGALFYCLITATLTTDFDLGDEYDDIDDEDDYNDEYLELNSTSNSTLQFVRELGNLTKSTGDAVKLRCEVKNLNFSLKVQFVWEHGFVPIANNKRIKVKNRQVPDSNNYVSMLRISDLEVMDKGFYKCIAFNGISRISSEGVLDVSNKLGTVASEVPTYKSIFDDGSSQHASFSGDLTTFYPSLDKRTKANDEFYSTIANPVLPRLSEQTINNPNLFEKTLTKTQKVPTYNASVPLCQLYRGSTCRSYLDNHYVFIQPPFTQADIETKLESAILVVSQSNDISMSCSKFAVPSLCFSAFPICANPHKINAYQEEHINKYYKPEKQIFKNLRGDLTQSLQRICKEDCLLLETELCSREYAIAKRHPVIGQTLELEECEFLPDDADKTGSCLTLGVDRTQNVNKDDTCYWDNGELYRGVQDYSVTGAKCIRWSHQFQVPLSEHPELIGHPYCRNPNGVEAQPFCFVEQTKRELCGLPKCANILWIYIIATATAFVVLTVLGTVFFCCRRKKKKTRALKNIVPSGDKNVYGNSGPNSPMELNNLLPSNIPPSRSHHTGNRNAYQTITNYTYKEVSFVEELGEGAFGKVYKGELKMKTGKIFVAVKSLKENANAKTQADFQREIELISELKHPNIICLLGIVVKQEPMCMIFEFMSEGDLHEFLINNSPSEGKCLTQIQFLHISIQIAQGMEYLSDNHYVHRDLAARNCLVSKDLVVKISDFGLSRDMYSCDYYRVQSKSLLPVRWMPPESILYGKFTTESDVWSYGVVLWEIYSYGLQPYYGYNNQEVINMIRSRKLLPCPEACPSYCYALMVECWAELAIRRPSFGEISHRLRVWKQNGTYTGAYFKNPEPTIKQQKYGHSSRSSHSTDSPQTVCPTFENPNDPSATWERSLKQASMSKLNESQSSLTSRCSSLGNKTQSTNLSDSRNHRKSGDRKSSKSLRNDGSLDHCSLDRCSMDRCSLDRTNPRNVVVNSVGDNFESKLSH